MFSSVQLGEIPQYIHYFVTLMCFKIKETTNVDHTYVYQGEHVRLEKQKCVS